ncbi:hypothetical protein NUW58_g9212 [Xylaria curta]|uniref:Uncharacterized protein n=1 Tax=Xylaria curta TaxID=42375 RepID=A0ACC1N081_9PEZI|nr:hypothetical protein NUW58_g9212 [Xylaria curta]
MVLPFPASEIGTYDIVAVRFVSSATTRVEWARAIENLIKLLKPGGWLQWIDSCNFALYNSVAGTSRAACQEIYDGLQPFRSGDDVVIGLMMREPKNLRREDVFRELGLVDVHEDVFSTDKLQDPELQLRNKGTRNVLSCFIGCLGELVGVEGSGWSEERIERLREEAMREIDKGVYHTLDQIAQSNSLTPPLYGWQITDAEPSCDEIWDSKRWGEKDDVSGSKEGFRCKGDSAAPDTRLTSPSWR